MAGKTALLFGATGLTGSFLLQLLLGDERYERIKVFSRRELDLKNPKIELYVVDVLHPEKYKDHVQGHDVFCCTGTTRKKAGSKEAFREVDQAFPGRLAKVAEENQVPHFLVLSSIGANPGSWNFYLRTKGLMEEEVLKHSFAKTHVLRPSLLLGPRKEFRFGEALAGWVTRTFPFIFVGKLKKYKGIRAEKVAAAMVRLANSTVNNKIHENKDIRYFSTHQ